MTKKALSLFYLALLLGVSGLPWAYDAGVECMIDKSTFQSQRHVWQQVRSILSVAEDPLQWNQTYGGPADDWAYSVTQTRDGGFALAGATTSFREGEIINYDAWLVKTDAHGILQWNQTYGSWRDDWTYSIIQTIDGGFALAGFTTNTAFRGGDGWLVKTDAQGIVQWDQTYGGKWLDSAHSIIQTRDGGFALTGFSIPDLEGDKDAWLVKTDAHGIVQWNQTYGGSETDETYSVIQTTDEGYLLAGTTSSYGAGGGDAWLVKTDAHGIVQWNQTYGGVKDEWANSVLQTISGGYVLAGATTSYGMDVSDAWLVKIDVDGGIQWDQTYDGASIHWNQISNVRSWEEAYSIIQVNDEGLVLAGRIDSSGGHKDAWLVKTDVYGEVEWTQIHGGSKDDVAHAVIQTTEGGFAIVGYTYSFGAGGRDAWLVKTEPLGATPPVRFISGLITFMIFPILVVFGHSRNARFISLITFMALATLISTIHLRK